MPANKMFDPLFKSFITDILLSSIRVRGLRGSEFMGIGAQPSNFIFHVNPPYGGLKTRWERTVFGPSWKFPGESLQCSAPEHATPIVEGKLPRKLGFVNHLLADPFWYRSWRQGCSLSRLEKNASLFQEHSPDAFTSVHSVRDQVSAR